MKLSLEQIAESLLWENQKAKVTLKIPDRRGLVVTGAVQGPEEAAFLGKILSAMKQQGLGFEVKPDFSEEREPPWVLSFGKQIPKAPVLLETLSLASLKENSEAKKKLWEEIKSLRA
jgi:hypothetical protein